MLGNIVENKVKIFISSKCCDNGKYTIMRRGLKELLINTGLAEVYIFEDAASSSLNVEESYLQELDNSDLCVFIIDNSEKLTEGVLKEYERAKALNKRVMYFFCDENEKKRTRMQIEIEEQGLQKYEIIHEFSKIIHKVFRSIMQDITNMYKYKNYISKNVEIQETKQDNQTIIYKVKKSDIKGLQLMTKELLEGFFTVDKIEEEELNEFDFLCAEFLKVVLKKEKINNERFVILEEKILEMYEGNLKEVIKSRLEAINLYYNGQIEKCIDKLKNIIKTKFDNIPEWIMNDVAIDLRNLQNIYYEMNNKICFENDGQKYMNNSEESVYYPMIDRIDGNRERDIIKSMINHQFDSPYSNRIENIHYIFDYISLCFYVALTNGSITHLRLTLDRMRETLLTLGMRYDDHDIYIQTIKYLILTQQDKEIGNLLRIYKTNVDVINSDDINQIYNHIQNIEIDYYKKISECLILKHFYNYFSEKDYNVIFKNICDDIMIWLEDDCKIINYEKYYFDMLKSNINRGNNIEICNIIIEVFENQLIRFYDNALDILQKLNYLHIENAQQQKIMEYLIYLMKDKKISNNIHKLENTIIFFRKRATIKTKNNLDLIVEKEMSKGFTDEYKLEIYEKNTEYKKMYINKCIEIIHKQNEEQGKNGVYSIGVSNEYITIRNIIKYHNIILETKEITKIIDILIETLVNDRQTINAKNSAIQLLIYLKQRFPNKRIWKRCAQIIIENKNKFITGKEDTFFDNETILLMKINMELLCIIFNIKIEHEEFDFIIRAMQLKDYDIIKLLQYINYILEEIDYSKIEDKFIKIILQYVSIMCNEKELDIRFWAVKCLIQLTYSQYKLIALQQLVNIMNAGNSELKIAIISRLKQISLEDNSEFIEFIIDKAKVDNNFLVRKIAFDFEKSGGKDESKK